jgi:hypothetical protein
MSREAPLSARASTYSRQHGSAFRHFRRARPRPMVATFWSYGRIVEHPHIDGDVSEILANDMEEFCDYLEHHRGTATPPKLLRSSPFFRIPQKIEGIVGSDQPATCAGLSDENCQRCPGARLRIAPPGSVSFLIPENEPGSSVMPGEVNPTQCEAGRFGCMATRPRLRSVAARGIFELNVFKPVIIHNFLHSVRLLTDVSGSFLRHCLTGSNAGRRKLAVPTVRS